MGYKQNRRIVRFGATSSGIVLPKGWLEFYQLEHRDSVTLLGDSILIIAIREDEERARSLLKMAEQELAKHQEKGDREDDK